MILATNTVIFNFILSYLPGWVEKDEGGNQRALTEGIWCSKVINCLSLEFEILCTRQYVYFTYNKIYSRLAFWNSVS